MMMSSQEHEIAAWWPYIVRGVDRIFESLAGLSPEETNWRPVANGNSLYALATHVVGSTEENLIEVLGGVPVHRQREAEFLAQGDEIAAVRTRWNELKGRVETRLADLPSGALEKCYEHPRRGTVTGREVLILVTQHTAEHVGHAELTRDLLMARRAG